MLSRWAIKRICRFLLKKKKLGDYIDLDQLDVQLAEGVIQLRDLALNVDFINEKLGDSPVFVKEGTILSLSIKVPWKMKNCQIEVEDLELVIAPCRDSRLPTDKDVCFLSDDEKESQKNTPEKLDRRVSSGSLSSASLDVHEGVKTIAKIVKWFLTSFNVTIRNLIVAFDPCSESDDSSSHRNLVLRIAEMEYGTRVSDDANLQPNSLLGIAKLTNFIKFHGAVIEFLKMDETCSSETSTSENSFKGSPSGSTSPVFTGAAGGFSGILNLSIPWKNGSLDISKVDADITLDPVELLLQPSTMKWIMISWESLKKVDKDGRNHVNLSNTDTVHPVRTTGTVRPDNNRKTSSEGVFSSCIDSQMNQGSDLCDSPSPPYIIQNWVTSDSLKGPAELEGDYGMSIDQFFECFDEVRSSRASLGNSGIWNWTCSVFSAITAASSLASESVYLPCEQQYSETNLKAKVSAFSIIVSFDDELSYSDHTMMHRHRQMEGLHGTTYESLSTILIPSVHHVEIKCQDLHLALQIFLDGTEVEATIREIKIDDTLDIGNEAERFLSEVSRLQAGVLGTLPACPFSNYEMSANFIYSPPDTQPRDENFIGNRCKIIPKGLVNVQLLKSFGACRFKCSLSSTSQNKQSSVLSSFSVYLPQFTLWVDFSLITMLLALLEKVGSSLKGGEIKDSASDSFDQKHSASQGGVQRVSPGGNLRGDIFLSRTRIVLCFPSENLGDMKGPFCWSRFLGLDFSSLPYSADKGPATGHVQKQGYLKGRSHSPSKVLHLHNGSLDAYLITSSRKNVSDNKESRISQPDFVSRMILSTTGGMDGQNPGITMLWQNGPVTGPWLSKRAWDLATLHDLRNKRNVTGKGDEFSSVKRPEDERETSGQVRQEMILSSSFLTHIHLPQVLIDLTSHEYRLLYRLLNEVKDGLSCLHSKKDDSVVDEGLKKEKTFEIDDHGSQMSVLLECDMLDIRIALDDVLEISNSLQKELPGSWNSLKLGIQKFELLSVSSVGGIMSDNFLWLSHGEGDLWGSMVKIDDTSTQDFLLITCKTSAMKRGDGEGGNILWSGSAGTSITHVANQELSQSFTSVNIRCATINAPGGRLDWFNAMCLFFSLPPHEDEMLNNTLEHDLPEGIGRRRQLFFLDLVDIALNYEPHIRYSGTKTVAPAACNSYHKPNDESMEKKMACLLAAASLSLYSQAIGNATSSDYNIRLQDIGLLVCEKSGSKNETDGYSVNYLLESNYVKIAKEALVNAVLRTNCENGLLWELEFSDSHISMGTCYDTTSGLVRLAAQLQQLFAPDVADALVHLQSRWDSVKQTGDENGGTSAMNCSPSVLASHEKPSINGENSAHTGIMDGILDNAFCWQGIQTREVDSCGMQSDASQMQKVRYNLDISSLAAGDLSLPNVSLNGASRRFTEPNVGLPHVIESYYASELQSGSWSSNEALTSQVNISANRDAELGKGRWFKETPLMIVEDHISDGTNDIGGKQSHQENKIPFAENAPETCMARGRVFVKNIDVIWIMYSGCDWPKEQKDSQSGSNSGENGRGENVCLELTLSGINLQYDIYPDGELFVSKLALSVKDFYLYDRSRNAPWKMVLGYYNSKDHPRESSAKAFKLELESVKPDPSTPLEEYRLQFSFLPMRLHLHQGQLDFLVNFFANDSSNSNLGAPQTSMKMDRSFEGQFVAEEALLPFFQKFDIYPAVLRVDYIPRHVDMAALRGGNYVQLINLVPWKGIDIQLKPVHAVGVYGWGSVCETVIGEWLEDISQNQIHKVLKGLTPVRSLFAVSSGAAKLVSLPVKTYKKDHRLLKGIQRGALAFLRSVSLEAIGLGVHLAGGAHELLLQTENILASVQPLAPSSRDSGTGSVRCNQPKNSQHGIQQAFESLSDGFGKTTTALVGTPLKEYQRGAGTGSALASAIRAAPVVAVAPASAVARAVHCTLLGVRNSLDPEHKKESMEKYLGSSRSRER
ncbi:unnamed protein product [Spirodela intermedia]|uniref:Autophagy-related protein 2 n=1 Tax=Spirodela intermedia TaxID=51605 RepID=A0A7I8K5T1_SPIIN|nr:unnamed protein product [Spirodela intermedia]